MTNLDAIELLVLDVDGVLTDGQLVVHGDGSESKCFHTHDGHGIRMWQRAGGKTALLSGRYSEPTPRRADQLEIAHVIQDCHFKLPALQKLLDALHLKPENVAYVGDDLPDLPPIRFVALGIAPANAVELRPPHPGVGGRPAPRMPRTPGVRPHRVPPSGHAPCR